METSSDRYICVTNLLNNKNFLLKNPSNALIESLRLLLQMQERISLKIIKKLKSYFTVKNPVLKISDIQNKSDSDLRLKFPST